MSLSASKLFFFGASVAMMVGVPLKGKLGQRLGPLPATVSQWQWHSARLECHVAGHCGPASLAAPGSASASHSVTATGRASGT